MRNWTRPIVVAAALCAIVVIPQSPAQAAGVPTGFADTLVGSFSSPTAVEWLPSDQLVVLEKAGRIRVADVGGTFSTAADLTVCTSSERGLLGFTHDPGFLGNGFVYVYYTRVEATAPGGCVNRVSRFTMTGTTINAASEVVLLDNISSNAGNHNGGDLDIGSDGYLYVSVGDAGRDPRGGSPNFAAQDLSLLNGKILRITLDGQPAPGNPFTGTGSARCAFRGNTAATPNTQCQEIYAYGLRNPYRFAFDRNDGSDRFFINDVGQGTREEVDEGGLGANYGWPVREGVCSQGLNPPCAGQTAGYTDPITDYGRDVGRFVTGGAFVPDGLWPDQYDGAYLFGDGGSGNIWTRAADGSVAYDNPFATDVGGLTDMTFGFDAQGRSALYYVQVGGTLRSITSTATLATAPTDTMTFVPNTPMRAYDTLDGTGVDAGNVVNGSTRLIDLDAPSGAGAALVNITLANSSGPGFLRTWIPRGARPETSTVNADQAGSFVANAAVVPLDGDGRFVVEAATTARVVVDVTGYFTPATESAGGRFVALDPSRIVDTRDPAGTDNEFTRTGDQIVFHPFGVGGDAPGDPAGAVVLSIGAIASPTAGGFVGAFPTGAAYQGTSNVNVTAGDVRANTVIVPLGDDNGISLETLGIDDVVVELVGYFTVDGAPTSTDGLFAFAFPARIVDTRDDVGFGTLGARSPRTLDTGTSGSGVLQNVTVTETSSAGWLATYPAGTVTPDISTVNFVAADQTRAVLAFTKVTNGEASYESLVPTDVVVDLIGTFT